MIFARNIDSSTDADVDFFLVSYIGYDKFYHIEELSI